MLGIPDSVLAVAVAAPGNVTIHEIDDEDALCVEVVRALGNAALAPCVCVEEGREACAIFWEETTACACPCHVRPAGTPNRVRFVEEDGALVAHFTEGE